MLRASLAIARAMKRSRKDIILLKYLQRVVGSRYRRALPTAVEMTMQTGYWEYGVQGEPDSDTAQRELLEGTEILYDDPLFRYMYVF